MANDATITFSQTGVQPPVYVTTSLSGWAPLEMAVEEDESNPGNLIFTKTFQHVAQGSYQYKIRLGDEHWVLDDSKETAADDQGIRNNVIHVEPPASNAKSAAPILDATRKPVSRPTDQRKDSTMDQDQLPNVAVPFVVVDKVKHQEQPAYAQPQHAHLPAHAGPGFEQAKADVPAAFETPRPSDISKVAHDTLDSASNHHIEPGTDEEQAAPLFRHESFQADEPPLPPSMDTIDEESTRSSAHDTSSGDAMDTPSELDQGDELNLVPLFRHETGIRHEKNAPAGEAVSVKDHAEQAPLFSHETHLHDDSGIATDSNRYPLLSHQGGFSHYRASEMVTKSDYLAGEEPQHYTPYGDDEEFYDYPEADDDNDAPLLPHEREGVVSDKAGSDYSQDDAPFSLDKQPTFSYETGGARNLFTGPGRHGMWRTRTNSNLPHILPRSDAEDEDLNDPSLERFPTHRDLILERVASIGVSLPEDESTHEQPNSPQSSVLSQACSSVDLAPVKSYASLASVPEADDSDEDDEEDRDVDSLPSPVSMARNAISMSSSPSGLARDPHATPTSGENKPPGHVMQTENEPQVNTRESSSQAESVDKHDGANLDSELRQRRGLVEGSAQKEDAKSTTTSDTTSKDKVAKATSSSELVQQPDNDKDDDSLLQHLFRVVFGPVGRFLTACVGDRKRASASVIFLGGAVAAYYYVAIAS